MAAQLPLGKGISQDDASFFLTQRKLRENFRRSVSLRARERPREFLEISSEAGSKTELLLRLILLKSSMAVEN